MTVKEKQNNNDDGEQGIEYGDAFTYFTPDDYVTKNIKVISVSGVTHADETKDGRQRNVCRVQKDSKSNEDGEDSNNKYAQLDLENQRKIIQTKYRD